MIRVGVIGYGYWGPNLVRNFMEAQGATVAAVCDLSAGRLAPLGTRYPTVRVTTDHRELLADSRVDAILIATPVASHFELGMAALRAGKHVLVEKPLAANSEQALRLVEEAERRGLVLMVDHTFIYTGAVRKIKEIVEGGELGDLLYFDSTRINLGLFQSDINVVWDLAPHDLSIMDYILDRRPTSVSATGSCHIERGIENIAYVMLRFPDEFIAHFHFNWLAPVKIRRTLIAGMRKMIVYDDIEPVEKVRVYDSGVTASRAGGGGDAVAAEEEREAAYRTLVSYRTGDVWAPKLDTTEALSHVCREFLGAVRERRAPLTDGHSGLRVVRLLEAAQQSINRGGQLIKL